MSISEINRPQRPLPEGQRRVVSTVVIAWLLALFLLWLRLVLFTLGISFSGRIDDVDAMSEAMSLIVDVFQISRFVLVAAVGVWIGLRLPRRGWLWGLMVGLLVFVSDRSLEVFGGIRAEVVSTVASLGILEFFVCFLPGASAYLGQCLVGRIMPPMFVRPWYPWEWVTIRGFGLVGLAVFAASLLPLRFDATSLIYRIGTAFESKGLAAKEAEEIVLGPSMNPYVELPTQTQLHNWAKSGDMDAIYRLTVDHQDQERVSLALLWFLVAQDYGHSAAGEAVNDLLETTILRYDDDGFALGFAHYDLLLAYLIGDLGLAPDFDKAAGHSESICAVFNSTLDIKADANTLTPKARIQFDDLMRKAREKCR